MNRSFMFLKAAFAVAAMAAAFLVGGASIHTCARNASTDPAVGSHWVVVPHSTLFRELSALRWTAATLTEPARLPMMMLAATDDTGEDEESADEEAATGKDDGFEGPDRLGNAPKLG